MNPIPFLDFRGRTHEAMAFHRWGCLTDRFGLPWMVNCMKRDCLGDAEASA